MEKEQQKIYWGQIIAGMLVGMLFALIICSVIVKNQTIDQSQKESSKFELPIFSGASKGSLTGSSLDKKITRIEKVIKDNFYLSDVTDEQLENGIYRGMLAALDDPYAEYYTEKELDELLDSTEGIYYGIGAYVSIDDRTDLPKISGIIEGAPAEEVDLRPNDLIYQIDGRMAQGLSLKEAVALIKGPEKTKVVLTLIREGEEDYVKVEVERRKVESPTVKSEMLDDSMAYIQITEFDDITVDQFADALATTKGNDMKGMILDLRGNPGGSLDAVVQIARMILPKGLVVYTEDKAGKRDDFSCDGKRKLEVPLVVLVDGNSASASEILAGAIQDYKIGTLVGTTTFGKGIVQRIISLGDGTAMKITVSGYFTPNGRNIHQVGIEPDIVCEFDAEAYYADDAAYDNQLEKAKEVLKDMIK